jgi:hypothetical protein
MLRIAELQQAEAHGRCDTPGNLSVLGDQIKALAKATAIGITVELGGCTALTYPTGFTICFLGAGGRGANLPALIDTLNAVGGNVDENTVLFIEAWGGDGAAGRLRLFGTGKTTGLRRSLAA